AVERGEDGDHGRDGDGVAAAVAEKAAGGVAGHAVACGDLVGRHHVEVRQVREHVDGRHGHYAADQRAGNVAVRVADLARRHVQVVPPVVGPQCGDERGEEADGAAAVGGRRSPVGDVAPAHDGGEADDGKDQPDLEHGDSGLDARAGLDADVVE